MFISLLTSGFPCCPASAELFCCTAYVSSWPITSISQFGPGPLLVEPDMTGRTESRPSLLDNLVAGLEIGFVRSRHRSVLSRVPLDVLGAGIFRPLGHVWTAPGWQVLSSRVQEWSWQPCVRPVSAVHVTAGHNALRGSGPGHKRAFDKDVAQVGCPDRRIDRHCITCCSPSQP